MDKKPKMQSNTLSSKDLMLKTERRRKRETDRRNSSIYKKERMTDTERSTETFIPKDCIQQYNENEIIQCVRRVVA